MEYKSSAVLNDEKITAVLNVLSSFANSEGGVLVIGIKEDRGIPVDIDNGVDLTKFSIERLDQLISSNINPKIEKFEIRTIDLSHDRCIFVIDTPRSTRAPHQSNDNKYYKRSNARTSPMEDYEVRDTLRRISHPILFVNPYCLYRGFDFDVSGMIPLSLNIIIGNKSSEPAIFTSVEIGLDTEIFENEFSIPQNFERGTSSIRKIQKLNRYHQFKTFHRSLSPSNHLPVFKEKNFNIGIFDISGKLDEKYYIFSSLACPGFSGTQMFEMEVTEKGISILDIS